jgi:hypothetical protein
MTIRLTLVIATIFALLSPAPVDAHGSVTPEDDICIIQIGYYKAHFKMYLPRSKGHREYCEDIPGTGETIFVMEYEHSGLGSVPVDFRVIRNVTGKGVFANLEDVEQIADLDSVTVVHHEAAVQPDVFTIMYDFEEQGEFVGIVTVQNPDTGNVYTAVFPFEVGFAGIPSWVWFVAVAILLQANYFVMNGWYARWKRERRKKKLVVISGSGHA